MRPLPRRREHRRICTELLRQNRAYTVFLAIAEFTWSLASGAAQATKLSLAHAYPRRRLLTLEGTCSSGVHACITAYTRAVCMLSCMGVGDSVMLGGVQARPSVTPSDGNTSVLLGSGGWVRVLAVCAAALPSYATPWARPCPSTEAARC
jgi:hypothetical protein